VWIAFAGCAGDASPLADEIRPRAPANAPDEAPGDTRFEAAAEYSASRAGHALLVVERGRVVYESGQSGHDAAEPHAIGAGTHAFWGVLAVAADDDGLLDLDEPVEFSLPEFADSPWKREMRVRQLLLFTSGLEPGLRPLAADPDATLAFEMVSRPGERFQYGPSHVRVFLEILRRKLGGSDDAPVDYLRERILDPIGLEVSSWRDGGAGESDLAGGAVLPAREWAKLGRLIANRGHWAGRTVLEPDAIGACLEGSDAQPGFGLGFWLNRSGEHRFHPGGPADLVVASGAPNRRLYVVPSLELVIVRFGGKDRRWRDVEFLDLVMRVTSGTENLPPPDGNA
jgi:CubicO group peptidase (beta-lactamase class C family)